VLPNTTHLHVVSTGLSLRESAAGQCTTPSATAGASGETAGEPVRLLGIRVDGQVRIVGRHLPLTRINQTQRCDYQHVPGHFWQCIFSWVAFQVAQPGPARKGQQKQDVRPMIRVLGFWCTSVGPCVSHTTILLDKHGKTVDSLLCRDRGIAAAQAFFRKALCTSLPRWPRKVTLDGHTPSHQALRLLRREEPKLKYVHVRNCRYLNNIVEQDHRAIKRRRTVVQ